MVALDIVVVLVIPVAAVVGLLKLVDALERRRVEVVSRQIAVTDAIHGAIGPVVAPFVRRGRHGAWIAILAVPPGHPQTGLMVEIAQAELGPASEIVLVAQEPGPARQGRTPAPTLRLSGARASR
jgi:hypothetical protein